MDEPLRGWPNQKLTL